MTNKRNPIDGQYNIHGHPLETVRSAKYLGVHIDKNLNFNAHVDATVKKANSVCAFLRRNFKHCNRRIKEATYVSGGVHDMSLVTTNKPVVLLQC